MMGFIKHFYLGLASYFKAVVFIYRNQLWYYFVFPLGCSLLLYYWGHLLMSNLSTYDMGNPSTVRELIWVMIKMLFWYVEAFIVIELRKYIVVTVLSPMIGRLSLTTEEILTGNRYGFSFRQFWSDTRRAFRIIFGNLVIQYALSLTWIILTLIVPPLQPYSQGGLLFIGFYFYGFGMIDYINERRRLNIDESVDFVRRHAGFTLAIGGVFSLMFLLPYEIGVTFAPVLAIVAATIGMNELVDLKKNKFAIKSS